MDFFQALFVTSAIRLKLKLTMLYIICRSLDKRKYMLNNSKNVLLQIILNSYVELSGKQSTKYYLIYEEKYIV